MSCPFMESGQGTSAITAWSRAILRWRPRGSQDASCSVCSPPGASCTNGATPRRGRTPFDGGRRAGAATPSPPEASPGRGTRERAPLEPLIGEANARETLEEGGELGLEPRKRRAQAEVRATPERAMVHTLARDVETASSLAAANRDPEDLHKLPVDALKIDRSFVKSLLLPERPAIVESIRALARTLNTSVVAEGIDERAAGARASSVRRRSGISTVLGSSAAPIAATPARARQSAAARIRRRRHGSATLPRES